MKKSTSIVEDSTDERLIEDICQIKRIALGEGAVVCQVCGAVLSGGSRVSVFVYRRAGEPAFELGHVVCGDNEHELRTHFTLGVRELVVDGRVGRCVDQALQSSWPVLLDPVVRVVSPMGSRTGCVASGRAVGEELSGESSVSWVFGDALLERAIGSDDDAGGDGLDAVPADADGFSTAGTGPAGSDDVVLADADGSGDDSADGTSSDVDGGEC